MPRLRALVVWQLVAALAALLIGVALPALVLDRALPLPLDRTFHAVSTAPGAQVATGPSPAEEMDLTVERTTTTSATEVDSVAAVDTEITVSSGGTQLARVVDRADLNRESTYPQAGGRTTLRVEAPVLGTLRQVVERDVQGEAREGLKYFFPADTEQRSFAFFDLLRGDSAPIDYADKTTIGGIDAYVFRHRLPAVQLSEDSRRGLAGDFYTREELDRFGLEAGTYVVMHPFHSVAREVSVDPATGTILDVEEQVRVVYAADAAQADGAVPASPGRTLISADLRWDDATRAAALDLAQPTVRLHKAMGAVSWAGKALAVIFAAWAAVRLLRPRPSRAGRR